MEKFKVYVLLDKEDWKIMSYDDGKNLCFNKFRKDVEKEAYSEIREAVLEVKIKGIDY